MANLTEVENYDAGVYQIAPTDRVIGGADGIDNKAATNLANRTKWLKARITELQAAIVPIGGIVLWRGIIPDIPENWQICDGTNTTPDLRNKFVVGAGGEYSVYSTGGSADAVVVSHTHTTDIVYSNESSAPSYNPWGSGGGDTEGTFSFETASEGVSGVNKNLPPYYALAYIMRVS